jgi:hypothetical protein
MNIPNIKITLRTVFNLFKSQDLHQDGGFTEWLNDQINDNDFFDLKDTYFLHDVLKSLNIEHDHLDTHEKGFTYKYFEDYPKVLIKEAPTK